LFDLIDPVAYYTRPISLRNPIVFYEGHLPAFSVIALLKRGLGLPGVDDRMEKLFERGIDPVSESDAVPRSGADTSWPSRSAVLEFGCRTDNAIVNALERAPLDLTGGDHQAMRGGEAIFTALEHEAMHQETLLYMWSRLSHGQKKLTADEHRPTRSTDEHRRTQTGGDRVLPDVRYEVGPAPLVRSRVLIPAGLATLGADRAAIPFGWDNEFGEHRVNVEAFEIDAYSVTNADFLEFLDAGGYRKREVWSDAAWHGCEQNAIEHPTFWVRHNGQWFWRGMFENIPLPDGWPVYVSHEEATAFARWKGRRLPTEAEYHRAAFGTPSGEERDFPWGTDRPDSTRGNFDLASWEPVPVGSRPLGASAWGVHDLVGNGWEWTSTIFGPFAGFEPMVSYPEYSADFFDGQHYVMKGASPGTAKELVRRSFRNWFRPNYPFVYAKFRTAIS